MKLTEILIATYSKDIPYLEWCLKSIRKFATGFSGVTIIVPCDEIGLFKRFLDQASMVSYIRVNDKTKWQLQAQSQKCTADIYCPDADFILHLDSDCIFTEPVAPDDYFVNGKPVMLIEEYSRMGECPWKAITEKVLGFPCGYETMRRHPQVNPVGIYRDMRAQIELVHNMPFERYVLNQRGEWPPGFSEHNAIGSFALHDQAWRDKYHWVEVGKQELPKEKVKQFWSLGPIDQPQGTPHDHDRIVPLDVCRAIIG